MLYDPTCGEIEDLRPALAAASRHVGWAPSAVAVRTVFDLVRVTVTVEVWAGAPHVETALDLLRKHALAFQSRRFSVDKSIDDEIRPVCPAVSAAIDAIDGEDTYRLQLWHLDNRPRWEDGDA